MTGFLFFYFDRPSNLLRLSFSDLLMLSFLVKAEWKTSRLRRTAFTSCSSLDSRRKISSKMETTLMPVLAEADTNPWFQSIFAMADSVSTDACLLVRFLAGQAALLATITIETRSVSRSARMSSRSFVTSSKDSGLSWE